MPYDWWNRFNNSDIEVENKIYNPVDNNIINTLEKTFKDFNRAYHENGMKIEEFESFGASVHTMTTFLDGYDEFINLIRNRMIGK